LNKSKAISIARKWAFQKPMPKELNPKKVWEVMAALEFELKGKNSDHTTFRWYHERLLSNKDYFMFGIISISVGHAKGKKIVVRIGSIKNLIRALKIYLEYETSPDGSGRIPSGINRKL
jgi:hypothetical protein